MCMLDSLSPDRLTQNRPAGWIQRPDRDPRTKGNGQHSTVHSSSPKPRTLKDFSETHNRSGHVQFFLSCSTFQTFIRDRVQLLLKTGGYKLIYILSRNNKTFMTLLCKTLYVSLKVKIMLVCHSLFIVVRYRLETVERFGFPRKHSHCDWWSLVLCLKTGGGSRILRLRIGTVLELLHKRFLTETRTKLEFVLCLKCITGTPLELLWTWFL